MTDSFPAQSLLYLLAAATLWALGLGAFPASGTMEGVEAIQIEGESGWATALSDGRFGISISPDGRVSAATAPGEFTPTEAILQTSKWHTVGFTWDCETGSCAVSVGYEKIADLPRLSPAPGVCYLRLWSATERAADPQLLVSSVSASVEP